MHRALVPILALALALTAIGCHNSDKENNPGSTDTIQTGATTGQDSVASNSSGGGSGVIATETPTTAATTATRTAPTGVVSSTGNSSGSGSTGTSGTLPAGYPHPSSKTRTTS